MKHFQITRRKDRGKDQAIQPIQQASMAGQQRTRIFHGKHAFNQRFKKIPNLSKKLQYPETTDTSNSPQSGTQKPPPKPAPNAPACTIPKHPPDGFARPNPRPKLSLPKIIPTK